MKALIKGFALSFSVVALLSASAVNLDGQNAEFGLRLMPTVSSLEFNTSAGGTATGKATVGLGYGAFLGFNFSDNIGVQAEVIYNSLSQKYTEEDVEREINLKYVNIPVLLSLNTGKTRAINLNVVAGPQLGISVGSSFNESGDNGNDPSLPVLSVKKGDLGLAYGAGLDFGINDARNIRLGIGFRGVYGLFDISDDSQGNTTDQYYLLDRTHIKTYSGYAGLSILF